MSYIHKATEDENNGESQLHFEEGASMRPLFLTRYTIHFILIIKLKTIYESFTDIRVYSRSAAGIYQAPISSSCVGNNVFI